MALVNSTEWTRNFVFLKKRNPGRVSPGRQQLPKPRVVDLPSEEDIRNCIDREYDKIDYGDVLQKADDIRVDSLSELDYDT